MKKLLAFLLGLAASSALAQGYPNRAVKLLVGFPPGGSTDAPQHPHYRPTPRPMSRGLLEESGSS